MIRNKKGDILIYIGYFIIFCFFLLPLLWIFSISLRPLSEVFRYPPTLIPRKIDLNNYAKILKDKNIVFYLYNSFKITIFTVLGTLVVSIPGAFAFSRYRFKFKKVILFSILLFQMISPLIIAIPLYNYFNKLQLLDTHLGVILVYIAIQIPFTVWLLKGTIDSIPISIDEAAKIDGCTDWQLLFKIILPLVTPGISTAVIFNAISSWGQFIIPFILLSTRKLFPISLGIYNYQAGGEAITIHLTATASIIATLPTVILFILLQKFIVSALTAGAVKE
ncbi:carbohydrate ABC transporter permease [Marinitoga sp. 1155]|uniref:carbohydrate ABC transporter permease n=1 Tax=Marinitoga sp. 1155 TaxID=1428448 RepID=UPI000640EA29|nr:carbohydrate ABC transporter permease [Marinitoga sp. 1155]